MDKVTIADSAFLQYGKSMSFTQDNYQVPLTYFEWEFADPQEARFVTDGYIKYARGKGQVAILLEPFFMHPENYLAAMDKDFDHVLTHNMNFVDNNENWLWYPFGGSSISFDLWKVYEKTKNISLISTRKATLLGHRMRREVSIKHAYKFDAIFGEKEFTRKFDCLADFRFSLVIESEKTPVFFNEKLIDCFSVGTIPIYWGCTGIRHIFDPRGIVFAEDMDEIDHILDRVDENYYKACLPAVKENLEIAKEYRIPEDWIYQHYPSLFAEKTYARNKWEV